MVKAIPEGYPRVTPYLIVDGAAAAIDFYKDVLGATERYRMQGPDGKIAHSELEFGNSVVMLSDEAPEMGYTAPKKGAGKSVGLVVYVEKVDEVFSKAVASGATAQRPVEDQFYGDRSGTIEDPFGHQWTLATHVEDVPPDEIQRRVAAMQSQ